VAGKTLAVEVRVREVVKSEFIGFDLILLNLDVCSCDCDSAV
jgi:hypothetical protein